MKEEKKQEIALMKYGAIAPLIAGLEDEHPSQIAFFRAVSEKGVMGADGRVQHYSPEKNPQLYELSICIKEFRQNFIEKRMSQLYLFIEKHKNSELTLLSTFAKGLEYSGFQ